MRAACTLLDGDAVREIFADTFIGRHLMFPVIDWGSSVAQVVHCKRAGNPVNIGRMERSAQPDDVKAHRGMPVGRVFLHEMFEVDLGVNRKIYLFPESIRFSIIFTY